MVSIFMSTSVCVSKKIHGWIWSSFAKKFADTDMDSICKDTDTAVFTKNCGTQTLIVAKNFLRTRTVECPRL